MPHKTAVINLVALTNDQLCDMPRLAKLFEEGSSSKLQPTLPAVTCTSQSTMLTGEKPSSHGIVGNGWHNRETAETRFWQQSNHLVQGDKIWDKLRSRDPSVTIANCFWWYAMYADVDVTVTPRPMYPADGSKIPDIWTRPGDLRSDLQSALGQFPLFRFWGPAADIAGSRWISQAAIEIDQKFDPTLLLVYLPHLDYGLQKYGPNDPRMRTERQLIDEVASDLIDSLRKNGRRILVVNEYGIGEVNKAVAPNRFLRKHGLLNIRVERGRELLDAGESDAFAVTDHQIAHVYLRSDGRLREIADLLAELDGVDEMLTGGDRKNAGLDHERAGDIVLVAKDGCWFCHDWWTDDDKAPDYQRTVDIHRKPGYDPRELFIDPELSWPKVTIGIKLLQKRLGFKSLMNVIPIDTSLVKGSHGRCDPSLDPLLWCSEEMELADRLPMQDVHRLMETLVFDS